VVDPRYALCGFACISLTGDFLWVGLSAPGSRAEGKWWEPLAGALLLAPTLGLLLLTGAMGGLLGGFTGFHLAYVSRPVHNKT